VAFGTNINCYEDFVSITGEEVFSPFHPDALDFYDFVLEGTSLDDGEEVAKIIVQPKTSQRLLVFRHHSNSKAHVCTYLCIADTK